MTAFQYDANTMMQVTTGKKTKGKGGKGTKRKTSAASGSRTSPRKKAKTSEPKDDNDNDDDEERLSKFLEKQIGRAQESMCRRLSKFLKVSLFFLIAGSNGTKSSSTCTYVNTLQLVFQVGCSC